MADFSRNYSPPGVYIEESDTTLVSVGGIPPTLVAIVGPARGYQMYTEQVVLSDEAVTLAKKGIDTDEVTVTVASTGVEVPEADYTLVKDSGTGRTYRTSLAAADSPSVAVGTTIFVTYRYTDPTYFDPKQVESFEDVKDLYGEPLNTTVANAGDASYEYVSNPLALAAMLAFQNGATDLFLVAAEPPNAEATTEAAKSTARRTNLDAAVRKLNSNRQVNVIVAVTTGIAEADASGVLTDLKTAMNQSANDGFYRVAVTGFDPTVTVEPDDLINTAGAASKRLMLAYTAPSGLLMYSGAANTTFSVGHQYLAAAYAGRMAALPVQYALTKQVIAGFSGPAGTPLSNSLKNQYAASGVAVTEVDRFGRLTVRHGVSTDPQNVNTREMAVVRAKDALLTSLADGMDSSGLIGSPIDSDTLLNVKSAVQGVLEQATTTETIVSYEGLAARQVSSDPTVIEIKFSYKPAYPLNYIVVSFSIDMNTGVALSDNNDPTVV